MLELLGLDTTTESVYLAMLQQPQAGITELADSLGLGEEEVRRALDILSELALIRPSVDPDGAPEVVNPQMGLEVLLSRQQAELTEQQRRIEASRAAAARLISEYARLFPASHPGTEQLVGPHEVRHRLSMLAEQVEQEVLAFAPGGPQTQENMSASRPLNQRLLDRGIRMRTLYLDSVRRDSATVEHAHWLAEHGAEVRTVPVLPTRMIIIDRATAVIAIDGDDSSQGAVVLTGGGTLTALCALFESTWAAGQPLGTPQGPDSHGVTPQYRSALELLAEGFTDEAIAKRLGVSPRTARRIATDLMDRLDARSRFQAGVHAARRSWLPKA
ncbi:helix-turn-helix domain-containing protein [Streptomyces sp. NPDC101237]|uniref:helix-turn-helix domain-containing protein n=1 Tax=Streptomyces sp. NPDC101237 TaxID=3366139 RepID=UPI0037F26553